jgi:FSR family fosmidomycin resistance protein-like MFS transporter
MKKDYQAPVLLGIAHAASDCAAGFLVGGLSGPWQDGNEFSDMASPAALLLLYNVLAFGGQLPAGMLMDRLRVERPVASLSLLMMAAALLVAWAWPGGSLGAVVLAGMGSALFHVCGGSIAYQSTPGKALGPGIFAAPGVTGLALGGWMSWQGIHALPYLLAALVLLAWGVGKLREDVAVPPQQTQTGNSVLERHDVWMLLLLLCIGMRSAVWNLWVVVQEGDHTLLIASALAAMCGKVGGGWLGDWIGWRRYAITALLLAIPLLGWGQDRPWLFLPGIALLQSATAPTLALLRRTLPGSPATAAGMGLGLGIALGGIPFLMGWPAWQGLFWVGPFAGAMILLGRRKARAAKLG